MEPFLNQPETESRGESLPGAPPPPLLSACQHQLHKPFTVLYIQDPAGYAYLYVKVNTDFSIVVEGQRQQNHFADLCFTVDVDDLGTRLIKCLFPFLVQKRILTYQYFRSLSISFTLPEVTGFNLLLCVIKMSTKQQQLRIAKWRTVHTDTNYWSYTFVRERLELDIHHAISEAQQRTMTTSGHFTYRRKQAT